MQRDIKKITWIAGILWTLIIAGSIAWNIFSEKNQTIARAESIALLAFNRDIEFRKWATLHGGVYVPITGETQPNPYLEVPEKYAVTDKGTRLTLISPAYMMRQLYESIGQDGGVKGHITSLNPLRPTNAPDTWEKKALMEFEKGKKEVFDLQTIDNKEHARFMRPVVTTKGCLKCHAKQGYKEGEIRGGISISVPMAKLRSFERHHINRMLSVHFIFWAIGLIATFFVGRHALLNEHRQAEAEERIRTAEERMAKAFYNSPEWITITTVEEGRYIEVNDAFERATGYSRDEVIGKTSVELGLWVNPDDRRRFVDIFERNGYLKNEEIILRMRSRETRTLLWSAQSIMVKGERCMLNIARDITEKIKIEEALKKSEERIRAFIANSIEGIWCFEMKEPIDTTLHPDEQLHLMYEHGFLIECNETMAHMHGYRSAEDIKGGRLGTFIPVLSKQNVDYLKAFIEAGYKLFGRESKSIDAKGEVRYFLNNLTGIVENGFLLRIWGVQHDITERKNLERQLETLSITDPLTALNNRRGFMTLAEQQIKNAQRSGSRLLLSFIDLDDMKSINDKYGHEEGDKALISAAAILKNTFRKSDIVARVGGDEFAVLAVNATEDDPEILTMRLWKQIDAFNEENRMPYSLSMSIGTAVYEPEKPCSLDELMAQADELMYEQKQKKKEKTVTG